MCCLKYEQSTYEQMGRGLPNFGDYVKTPEGDGIVKDVNVLAGTIKVEIRNKKDEVTSLNFYPADQVTKPPKRTGGRDRSGEHANEHGNDASEPERA